MTNDGGTYVLVVALREPVNLFVGVLPPPNRLARGRDRCFIEYVVIVRLVLGESRFDGEGGPVSWSTCSTGLDGFTGSVEVFPVDLIEPSSLGGTSTGHDSL